MPADPQPLAGARILVVEDEELIAMLLEDMLADLGCTVVGPVGTVAAGLATAARGGIDAAILDVSLRGEPVYPVADALAAAGVPLLFASGYGAGGLDPRFAGHPMLGKPYQMDDLAAALATVLGRI